MSEPPTPLVALSLDPAAFAPHAAARVAPAAWLELAQVAEAAGVSLITLADTHRAPDGVARLDAVMLAAFLAARTRRIGILASADTTLTEPYLLATQIATADFVSAGRAGWLAQVSGGAVDARYVGPRAVAVGEAAWAEAAEFVEVVRALWDSWEDDAEIRDITQHRFIDRERLHHIDFTGEHLTVKGPSITPRPPQGQPPVGVEVRDARSRELAVSQADVVFLSEGTDPESIRAAAAELGRGAEVRLLLDRDLDTVSRDDLARAGDAGFDGVRLIPARLPGDLAGRLAQLGIAPGVAGTLRDRLGLPRPVNRYAAGVLR